MLQPVPMRNVSHEKSLATEFHERQLEVENPRKTLELSRRGGVWTTELENVLERLRLERFAWNSRKF